VNHELPGRLKTQPSGIKIANQFDRITSMVHTQHQQQAANE
jgi:hypothetical protein